MLGGHAHARRPRRSRGCRPRGAPAAWRGIERFQGRSGFSTWLYRIVINEANRAIQKRGAGLGGIPVDADWLQLAAPRDADPPWRAEQRELRQALELAIGRLAPAHRIALVLRDIEGLSTREAALIVGGDVLDPDSLAIAR